MAEKLTDATTKEPKYRKRLNAGQLEVLELLLRLRFGTTELIAQALGKKNGTIIKSRLNILREQDYIDRHYRGADRLQGKHAAYYLSAKGARALRSEDARIIKRAYKDKKAGRQFIDHNLSVFAIYCRTKAVYGDAMRFFTKTDLADYDYFPQPLPDAFMSYKEDGNTSRFFVNLFETTMPAFALNRQIKQLIDYNASGDWSATGSDFPVVLIICDTPVLQSRIEKRINASLHSADDTDDLVFATTNQQAFMADTDVWRVAEEDELVSLHKFVKQSNL